MGIQNINTVLSIFTDSKYWLGAHDLKVEGGFQWTYNKLTQFYLYLQPTSTGWVQISNGHTKY